MASVIQNEINRIVAERDTQTNLISQIATALEGKAAGGGGGSIETCNVTISSPDYMPFVKATVSENGIITPTEYQTGNEITINNVVKGSIIVIKVAAITSSNITFTNATLDMTIMFDEFGMTSAYTAIAG